MKIKEKYNQLQNETYLLEHVTNSVYATMQLENQGLPKQKIREIVLSVLKEQYLKRNEFSLDKSA